MAIPAIAPYEIPRVEASGAAAWSVDVSRSALLIHDMQNYFVRAYRASDEPVRSAVANMRMMVERARALGVPVLYSAQPVAQHAYRRGLLRDVWGEGMQRAEDAEIIAELAPAECDVVLTKWRYSAFERTDLEQVLKVAGRDQLVITGVYGHMGCMVTAVDAFMKDIQPFFVVDAIADFSAEEHEMAARWVAKRAGCVVSSAQVVESWDRAHKAGGDK
ncbi:MAG: isochorismatase family protein [Corynebacterium sp.]|uniref:isochorismatase family protein n=1 Tax=Corynebacterium sp. TaxID=1720 RepID=UPI0026DCA500|nr:isochorismatase family protein [Corynebacterium sp.]MDO4761654.1 isochorismatase family protein [Corynebacterium sp.]